MKLTLAAVLVGVALAALILTGWTYHRTLDSHETVRRFDVQFIDLSRHASVHGFDLHLSLVNDGEVTASVETLSVLLRLEGRLIASSILYPDDWIIAPGAERRVSVELVSNLDEELLPPLQTEIPNDHWSVRVYAIMTQPVREGDITLYRESTLRP